MYSVQSEINKYEYLISMNWLIRTNFWREKKKIYVATYFLRFVKEEDIREDIIETSYKTM